MIANRKEFYLGIGMLTGFIVFLVIMFMPIYSGNNALAYLDAPGQKRNCQMPDNHQGQP